MERVFSVAGPAACSCPNWRPCSSPRCGCCAPA